MLCYAKWAICQLYHGENKLLRFDEMIMMSALYKTNTHSCIFIGLAHRNTSPWTGMSLHMNRSSWLWDNPFLLKLLNDAIFPISFLQVTVIHKSLWTQTDIRNHSILNKRSIILCHQFSFVPKGNCWIQVWLYMYVPMNNSTGV